MRLILFRRAEENVASIVSEWRTRARFDASAAAAAAVTRKEGRKRVRGRRKE